MWKRLAGRLLSDCETTHLSLAAKYSGMVKSLLSHRCCIGDVRLLSRINLTWRVSWNYLPCSLWSAQTRHTSNSVEFKKHAFTVETHLFFPPDAWTFHSSVKILCVKQTAISPCKTRATVISVIWGSICGKILLGVIISQGHERQNKTLFFWSSSLKCSLTLALVDMVEVVVDPRWAVGEIGGTH